jgi:hypothetical protein
VSGDRSGGSGRQHVYQTGRAAQVILAFDHSIFHWCRKKRMNLIFFRSCSETDEYLDRVSSVKINTIKKRFFEMGLLSTFTSINLPVKNVEQSKAFFTGLGFELNPEFPVNENSAAIMIGENLQVMLIDQAFFNTLTEKEAVDTGKYAQLTIALAFDSREKVDEIVNTALSLGGKLHADPEDYGTTYHWGFVDLDGHLGAINCYEPTSA